MKMRCELLPSTKPYGLDPRDVFLPRPPPSIGNNDHHEFAYNSVPASERLLYCLFLLLLLLSWIPHTIHTNTARRTGVQKSSKTHHYDDDERARYPRLL